MKLSFLIISLIFSLAINVDSKTIINEVMYDPEGSDNNKEFIELYSDEANDFENYTIEDLSGNIDILKTVKKINGSYFLIVEEGFDYTNINASVYNVGATIGNNLNNDKDLIILRNDSKIIDLFYYSSDYGGSNNNHSLERINFNDISTDPRNWIESKLNYGSPGLENGLIDLNFNSLKINEFLPDPFGNDDAQMPRGEFIEIYNEGEKEVSLDNFYLEDKLSHRLKIDKTHSDNILIKGKSYLTVYTNGLFGFLNNDEDEIKLVYNNIVLDKVGYSFSKEDFSWSKYKNNWILTHPTPNLENEQGFILNKSSVKIIKYDNKVNFGELIEIKLDIYKGDNNKNSIDVVIEKENIKVSNEVNLNIYGKYVNYTINVPLQIYPNCDLKFEDGEYSLKVSGLDDNDKKLIKISGSNKELCNNKEEVEKEVEKKVSTQLDLNEDAGVIEENIFKEKISGEIVYESSDIKTKNSMIYFLVITLFLIILFLIFRKGL